MNILRFIILSILVSLTFAQGRSRSSPGHLKKQLLNTNPKQLPPQAQPKLRQGLEALRARLLVFFADEGTNFVATFVQMVFHDCVGGCDGCLDPNNDGNKGLDNTISLTISLRNQYVPNLSQADANVFIGIEAIKHAAKLAGGNLNIPYSIGRKDCQKNRLPFRNIPHGRETSSVQILRNMFNLNDEEAVAMLGCHSLGRTRPERSGYNGGWDRTPKSLDSSYFSNMMNRDWIMDKVDNQNAKSHQWSTVPGGSRGMMLHADMICFKKFTISGEFDTPSCDFNTCPLSPTAHIVQEFADNQAKFHLRLASAMTKMIEFGQGKSLHRI